MAKINKNLFKGKPKDTIIKGVNVSKGLRTGKKVGKFALGLITKIHPVARVGSLLYKAGRVIYLRQQTRNLGIIAKRSSDIIRKTPVMGRVVIQPAKGNKIVKRAKTGNQYASMTYNYLRGIKRTKATKQKLIGMERKIPGGVMKSSGGVGTKTVLKTNRSTVALARKRRALRQEASIGMGIKGIVGLGAYKGGKRLTQTQYGALPLDSNVARQNLIISSVRKAKGKKYGTSNLTEDQMDSIFKRLR
jgi:hypothetical protein